MVMATIQIEPKALYFASTKLKDRETVATLALKLNQDTLPFISERLLNNKEFILQHVHKKDLLCRIPTNLKNDIDFLSRFLGYPMCDNFLSHYFEHKEIADIAIQHSEFIPTIKQMKTIKKEYNDIYLLRRDEWLAKIEEMKLREFFLNRDSSQ